MIDFTVFAAALAARGFAPVFLDDGWVEFEDGCVLARVPVSGPGLVEVLIDDWGEDDGVPTRAGEAGDLAELDRVLADLEVPL